VLRCDAVSCCVNDLLKWLSVCQSLSCSACSRQSRPRLLSEAADYHRSYSLIQGLPMPVISNIFVIYTSQYYSRDASCLSIKMGPGAHLCARLMIQYSGCDRERLLASVLCFKCNVVNSSRRQTCVLRRMTLADYQDADIRRAIRYERLAPAVIGLTLIQDLPSTSRARTGPAGVTEHNQQDVSSRAQPQSSSVNSSLPIEDRGSKDSPPPLVGPAGTCANRSTYC